MPKMVINTRFGGFRLSPAAHEMLGSVYVKCEDTLGYWDTSSWDEGLESHDPAYRSLAALVRVVNVLGSEADGRAARLKVVDVPDDAKVHISDYDGRERVREDHRSWG